MISNVISVTSSSIWSTRRRSTKTTIFFAWYEKEICTYTWGAKYADAQLPDMPYHIPNVRYDFENMIGEELVHSSAWRGGNRTWPLL